jgi:hypothetical protein
MKALRNVSLAVALVFAAASVALGDGVMEAGGIAPPPPQSATTTQSTSTTDASSTSGTPATTGSADLTVTEVVGAVLVLLQSVVAPS